jgi:aspartyl-tRNA(Asn)/glutamyl-tRNA(Gln) amidotransferase subunit A
VADDLHDRSLGALAKGLADGAFSSRELVEHFAARIEALEPTLNALRLPLLDEARDRAAAMDAERAAGRVRGPLHGLPYVAKDLFDVAGTATSAGCPLLEGEAAARHSTVVSRLEAAGMVLLGKTHTVQFAYGGAGVNTQHGTPRNPWHQTHYLPGGSSSGSGVAVGAGMAPMGLGTDTGGSVRIPASLCGVTGLKTTVGRVSRAGVYPLSWSLDSVGPLCRDAADAALVLDVLNGEDPADPSTHGHRHEAFTAPQAGRLDGLRVAVAETVFFDGADEAVRVAVRDAATVLAELGARVESAPFPEAEQALTLNPRGLVIAAEAWTVNRRLMEEHFDALDPVVSWRVAKGREVTAEDYLQTVLAWGALRARAAARFEAVDLLLCPATMYTARPLADAEASMDAYSELNLGYLRNTAIGNILNLCAISVPCGRDAAGLPVGLMLYARPFAEATVLRAAAAYQGATQHHHARPALDWAWQSR